jgi:hypothetical protein
MRNATVNPWHLSPARKVFSFERSRAGAEAAIAFERFAHVWLERTGCEASLSELPMSSGVRYFGTLCQWSRMGHFGRPMQGYRSTQRKMHSDFARI